MFEPDVGHLLQQLRDIHPPPEPSWWPPAPGWWLLALLAVLGCIALAALWRRRVRRLAPYRQAEKELNDALARIATLPGAQQGRRYAHTAHAILRRLMAVAAPDAPRGCVGPAWWAALDTAGGVEFPREARRIFDQARFAGEHLDIDVDALHALTLRWIRAARARA